MFVFTSVEKWNFKSTAGQLQYSKATTQHNHDDSTTAKTTMTRQYHKIDDNIIIIKSSLPTRLFMFPST